MEPLVSIIMPAFNVEKFIGAAIQSILEQTYNNFELIIINDGSTDKTDEVIKNFKDRRIVYYKNSKNLKLPKSLNIGIDMAKGKYICRSDADDINIYNRLETQVHFMESHPEVDLVGSSMYVFDNDGNIIGGLKISDTEHDNIIRNIYWFTPLMHATIMAKSIWMRKYRYRENYPRAEDYDMFLRSYFESRFANIPSFLYAVRDPGKINVIKMVNSSLDNMKMRFCNWREYKMPIRCILWYPFLIGARFIYYTISMFFGKSFFWGHLQYLKKNKKLIYDQNWIKYCLSYSLLT